MRYLLKHNTGVFVGKYFISVVAILVASFLAQGQSISSVRVDKKAAEQEIFYTIDARNWPNSCESFSSEKGYGFWGKFVAQELSNYNRYRDLIEGTDDLVDLCPRYPYMRREDRYNVWVMILLNMAYYESSCEIKNTAKGPNGQAAGLLQLHGGQEYKYSKGCQQGDATSAGGSIRCSLNMLNDQSRRDGKLFSSKSYWEVLRPKGRSNKAYLIQASIVGFQPCRYVR